MNIIIADDHQLILDGLTSVLNNEFSISLIKGVLNKNELFNKLERYKFDILIQDLRFGDDNARAFITDIRKAYPKLKIIILSSVSDSVTIKQLSKKIDGYILKSEPLEEIIIAINTIKSGEKYFSQIAKKKMNLLIAEDTIILTKREQEVLSVIMKEKSTKQIAEELHISEKTVELHRSNLFIKLNVKNITGLVKKTIAFDLLNK